MNITPDFKYKRPFTPTINITEFRAIFSYAVNTVMADENRSFEFQIDEDNREFINDVFFYLNYDARYSGDLNKGILLIGKIGSGKSILMKTMLKIIEVTCNKFVKNIHSKMLITEIEDKGIEYFKKLPLYIDDLGKEQKEAKVYGNIFHPVEDIISLRDQQNSITFASGNYEMKTYEEFYSKHIIDRMYTMFNVHILKGESRREKNIQTS